MDLLAGVFANFVHKHPGRCEHVNKTVDNWSTRLWSVAWGKHNGTPVFEMCNVEQYSAASLITLDVPKQSWILKGTTDQALSSFDVKDAFIQDQYFKAIHNILSYMQMGMLIDTSDKDMSTVISSPPGRDTNAMDQDSPPFPNPFLNYKPGHHVKDVILTGNPGLGMVIQSLLECSNGLSFCCTGKSLFLHVLLALWLCAGIPTIFQDHPSYTLIFSEDGIFTIKSNNFTASEAHSIAYLFPELWCLLNSNHQVSMVLWFITDCGLPIIDATSPHAEHLQWYKKRSCECQIYIMKPWDFSELIIGYCSSSSSLTSIYQDIRHSFQPIPIPKKSIKECFDQFMPST